MDEQGEERLEWGVALIATAGCVDAIGFLRLGGLFVSFMSGNSTKLAIALAQERFDEAQRVGLVVAAFVLGALAGKLIATAAGDHRRPVLLLIEGGLLAAAVALGQVGVAPTGALALAMGAQNAVLPKGRPKVGLTYVTGTLASLGEALAEVFTERRWGWAPYAVQWAALMIGAVAGALLYAHAGLYALGLPIMVLIGLAIWSLVDPPDAPPRRS